MAGFERAAKRRVARELQKKDLYNRAKKGPGKVLRREATAPLHSFAAMVQELGPVAPSPVNVLETGPSFNNVTVGVLKSTHKKRSPRKKKTEEGE